MAPRGGAALALAAALAPGAAGAGLAFPAVHDSGGGLALAAEEPARTLALGQEADRTLTSEDCTADLLQWEDKWTATKKQWCCRQYGLGCEARLGGEAYDCSGGPFGWSQDHRRWCCSSRGVGCDEPMHQEFPAVEGGAPSTSAPPGQQPGSGVTIVYDCSVGLADWAELWTPAKLSFCCRQWDGQSTWPMHTPSGCCRRENLGCDRFHEQEQQRQSEEYLHQQQQQQWQQQQFRSPPAQQEQQPQHMAPGGSPIAAGDVPPGPGRDCRTGLDRWRSEWSVSKMSWCCQDWDATGAWPEQRPDYCCTIEGLGCGGSSGGGGGGSGSAGGALVGGAGHGGGEAGFGDMTTAGPTTTNTLALDSYDCEADEQGHWQLDWHARRRKYCCWRWAQSEGRWSVANGGDHRQEYCCMIEGYGCPKGLITTSTTVTSTTRTSSTTTTVPTSWDCEQGLLNWRTLWTDAQREYCCLTAGAGCPEGAFQSSSTATTTSTLTTSSWTTTTVTSTTPEATTTITSTSTTPSTSLATTTPTPVPGVWLPGVTPGVGGIVTLAPMPTLPPVWTPAPWDPSAYLPTTTSTTEDPAAILARLPADESFDCRSGASHWDTWWSPEKVAWCCHYQGVGCAKDAERLSQKFEGLGGASLRLRGSPHGLFIACVCGLALLALLAAAAAGALRAGRARPRAGSLEPLVEDDRAVE